MQKKYKSRTGLAGPTVLLRLTSRVDSEYPLEFRVTSAEYPPSLGTHLDEDQARDLRDTLTGLLEALEKRKDVPQLALPLEGGAP